MTVGGGGVGVGMDISLPPGTDIQTQCDEKPDALGSSDSLPNFYRVEGKCSDGGLCS